MIDFTEIQSGEVWELFARDFLAELGLAVESPPDRGADQGKDLLVQEDRTGSLGNTSFRWLVSCKHNAVSGKAVNESDEPNIVDRVEGFAADGFIGFYSTVPSSNLNSRLRALRTQRKIKDYRIFDHKLIENHLIRVGYAHLVLRYFPESYKQLRPLHVIVEEYEPLCCEICGKDLLQALFRENYRGIVVQATSGRNDEGARMVEDVAWVCKGECDARLEERYGAKGWVTGWEDISDLVIPAYYLQYCFAIMNSLCSGRRVFSDRAYDRLKQFVYCLGQKTLRETTPKEREWLDVLAAISILRA